MKLINNSPRNYIFDDIIFESGKILELDKKEQRDIIKIFKKQVGVEEYISKEDVVKLEKELEDLKKEKEIE